MPAPTDVFFTQRAFERLRYHYPNCGVKGASAILAAAREIGGFEVDSLTGKTAPPDAKPTRFFRTADGRGIFVLVPADDHDAGPSRTICATYIRLDKPSRVEGVQA